MIDKKRIHKWTKESKDKDNETIKFIKLFEAETARAIIDEYPLFTLGSNVYFYDNGLYTPKDNIKKIINIVSENSFSDLITKNKIDNIISFIKELSKRDYEELNCYPKHFINFKNGMYNPVTRKLDKHYPKYLSINQIPHNLDKSLIMGDGISLKDVPVFNKFLISTIQDEADREMLLQFLAYCFTISMEAQKALFIVGEAGTGKSVLLRLIVKILGGKNTSSIKLQDLNKPFSSAEIVGKLLNCDGDLTSQALQDISTFKNITGQDTIQVEEKYQKPFIIQPYSKMIYSMNRIPKNIDEKSEGYYRRLLILRIPKRGEEIYNLEKELEKEIPLIIGLLMNKLKVVLQNNYKIFESLNSKREVKLLREVTDSIQHFINLYILEASGARTKRSEIYEKYKEYCFEYERDKVKKSNFYRELEERGFECKKYDGYDCIRDIVLLEKANHSFIDTFESKDLIK